MLGWLVTWAAYCQGNSSPTTNEVRIVGLEGIVEVSPSGASTWLRVQSNQVIFAYDRLRTSTNSRAVLRWSNQSMVPLGASTEIQILPPHAASAQSGLKLVRGILSFFHRDEPGRIRVLTRGAIAGVEGTEFVLAVADVNGTERATLSVVDGKVQFGNELASLVLTNGEQAFVDLGQPPARSAGFIANNVLQWCFYYPAVLDLADLPLTPEQEQSLAESLQAYRSGDLLAALEKYPAGRPPANDTERVYRAALLLSVGEVEAAETIMSELSTTDGAARPQKLAIALRQLIAAVKHQEAGTSAIPETATEFLARSYYEQSRGGGEASLAAALEFAREATVRSPQFGFAWARVAELEFSFGRNRKAADALNRSLELSPRNAQALALRGFLLAGGNKTREAIEWFDKALAVDSGLGNAWLGRGLCRIRIGDAVGGREDLLVAAAKEPQRAELRSYLGKANANFGDTARATKELELAKKLDPNDPTAWLYSALLNQQNNRINDAIRDLEKSQELNDNRSVYRSQLLLDQDRAVRSANLANIYRDAGMTDVSVREAARAVNADYANYSAHLFLAASYQPDLNNQISQRYETPSEVEFLLANLLSPVGAGTLSSTISRSEYSRLFEQNRFGIVSDTEYLSRGAWSEFGAQYGTFDKVSYDFDWAYASDPGQYRNNDFELWRLQLQLKLQITPQDTIYGRVSHYNSEFGDLAQYYDPTNSNPNVRLEEEQEPIITLGYHHEWNPGVHTLFLATRLDDTLTLVNPLQPTIAASRPDAPSDDTLVAVIGLDMNQRLATGLEIYSAELQQIWESYAHGTIVGTRFQYGEFNMGNLQVATNFVALFDNPAAQQDIESDFRRFSVYGYHQWRICDEFQLVGGLSYDWISFPENFRYAPVSAEEQTEEQLSPKAGFIWTPLERSTIRFAYTRSLAGASIDQSYQIEPSQVAGFVQSFRSIMPESIVGGNAGAEFETFDLSLEQKFETGTYLGVSGEILNSDLERVLGAFDVSLFTDFAVPSGIRQNLDYSEQSVVFSINQLLGKNWSVGARYRLSHADLETVFVEASDTVAFIDLQPREHVKGVLHEVNLSAIYNHQSGFYAAASARYYSQANGGDINNLPGDSFWQCDGFIGYRLPRRFAEVQLALLNIFDQDYRLHPINLHANLPRERTLAVRFRLNF